MASVVEADNNTLFVGSDTREDSSCSDRELSDLSLRCITSTASLSNIPADVLNKSKKSIYSSDDKYRKQVFTYDFFNQHEDKLTRAGLLFMKKQMKAELAVIESMLTLSDQELAQRRPR